MIPFRRPLCRKQRQATLEQLETRELLAVDALEQLIASARQSALDGRYAEVADVEAPVVDGAVEVANEEAIYADDSATTIATALGQNQKPRLIVLTDIGGGDPDDEQSMVRLLTYANKFDIEGLVAGASTNGTNTTNPFLIHNIVNHYESVRSNLLQHESGFPTASQLRSTVAVGQPLNGAFGAAYDTQGSNLIIQAVDKADSRPVNIAIWGGSTDLAQALWRVRQTRSASEVDQFVSKIRVAWIEQNSSDAWIKSTFPNLWVVSNIANGNTLYQAPFRGMYLGGDTSLTTAQWVIDNVNSHQPYGNPYPTFAAGDAMKEGDTPTWFYFLPSDLSDPDHPEWGGWGGRYTENGNVYSPAADYTNEGLFGRNTVNRWREEYQNDFAARMDWTVSSNYSQANHNPVAVINQPNEMRVTSGQTVAVSAASSWDPDGDALSYEWFQYREAGTYPYAVSLNGTQAPQVRFTAPSVSTTQTVHLILKLRDDGAPNLFDYQRIVVTIDPATDPVTVPPKEIDTTEPTAPIRNEPVGNAAQAVVDLRFNEAAGNLAFDSSGNNTTANLLNTENRDWVAGVEGTAIRLDSHNERVRVANSPTWSGNLESFSVSAWVRFDDLAGMDYNSIISVGNWTDQRINLYPVNGSLQFFAASNVWSTSVESSPQSFLWNPDGQYHQIVLVKDAISHSASIYVDGTEVGRDEYSAGTVDLSGWDLSFCGTSWGQKQLGCSLDNAAFYHGALTASEILALYRTGTSAKIATVPNGNGSTPPPQELTSAAAVDLVFDGPGTQLQDQTGQGNTGTLVNTESTDWVPGYTGTALQLDGSDERVRVPSNSSWATSTDTLTVSTWMRLDDPANSNYQSILSVGSWQDQRLNVYPLNGQLVFTASTSEEPLLVTSPWQSYLWQPDGRFHHIVAVKDATTASLYVDGELLGQDNYARGQVDLRGWDLSFCANSAGNHALPCTIDGGGLYHHAMTADQVQELYRAGPTEGAGTVQVPTNQPSPTTPGTDNGGTTNNGPYIPSGAVIDLRFDEGSGTVTTDQSGRGNNANLLATAAENWVDVGGTKAVQLDGVYEQVRVGAAENWGSRIDDLTLSMWVRFDQVQATDYRILASVGDWSDQRLAVYPVDGSLRFVGSTDGSGVNVASKALPFLNQADGQFHNLVFVKDAATQTASIYVDGFLVGHADATGTLDLRGWGLALGGDSSGGSPIPVTIASTKMYHRVLENREISDLFLAGSH